MSGKSEEASRGEGLGWAFQTQPTHRKLANLIVSAQYDARCGLGPADRVEQLLADFERQVRLETLEKAAKLGHRVAFEFLGMHREQRTYSWHDVEDALTKAAEAIRASAEAGVTKETGQ